MSAMEDVAAWVAERDARQARIQQVLLYLQGQGYPENDIPPVPDATRPISRNAYRKLELEWRSSILDFLMSHALSKRRRVAEPRMQKQASIKRMLKGLTSIREEQNRKVLGKRTEHRPLNGIGFRASRGFNLVRGCKLQVPCGRAQESTSSGSAAGEARPCRDGRCRVRTLKLGIKLSPSTL